MLEKIVVTKSGNEPPELYYETNKDIGVKEYEELLNSFVPNFSFSITDKLIQDLPPDHMTTPTFKRCALFTNDDLDEIVKAFKKDYIVKTNKPPKKKYFKKNTQKKKKG